MVATITDKIRIRRSAWSTHRKNPRLYREKGATASGAAGLAVTPRKGNRLELVFRVARLSGNIPACTGKREPPRPVQLVLQQPPRTGKRLEFVSRLTRLSGNIPAFTGSMNHRGRCSWSCSNPRERSELEFVFRLTATCRNIPAFTGIMNHRGRCSLPRSTTLSARYQGFESWTFPLHWS